MAGVYLSPEELSALYGAPWLVGQLYVFGIRPQMDFNSGLVGRYSKISWHGLARELRVESAPGIKEVLPSKSQVRRAADHLVKRGLVAIKSDGDRLVFQCLIARVNSGAQIKADTKPTQLPGMDGGLVNPSEGAGFTGDWSGLGEKAGTKADTVKKQKPTHIGVSESSLSTPITRETFAMYSGWVVKNDDYVEGVLRAKGLPVDQLSMVDKGAILDEFVNYWLDRPDRTCSQKSWEQRFIDSAAWQMERRA